MKRSTETKDQADNGALKRAKLGKQRIEFRLNSMNSKRIKALLIFIYETR